MGVAAACGSDFYTYLMDLFHLWVPRCPDKSGKDVQ